MTNPLTASLTLVRPGQRGPEVFWARRRPDRSFLGGFHAFFAGSVEPGDQSLVADGSASDNARIRAAALRETFEESGLLITDAGIEITDGIRTPNILAQKGLSSAIERLELLGWWNNPEWMKPTYATAFFGLRLGKEEGQKLDDLCEYLDPKEFDGGRWIEASKAVDKWSSGEIFSTTPIVAILRSIADAPASAQHLPRPQKLGPTQSSAATGLSGEICGGVTSLPLKTATLPPATHTNCVVAGRRRFAVIDPGPSNRDDLQPLVEYLSKRTQRGDQCIGVVLTHHHRDHIGGVEAITDILDVPLFAHTEAFERLDTLDKNAGPTCALADGDTIDIDHPGPLRVLHTPGHAPDHLALFQSDIGLLIGGDLVASQGTIVIDPPDGDMGAYLDSLRRIRAVGPRAILPGHGQLITAPDKLVDDYIEHRKMREQKVFDALQQHGPATAAQLVSEVYTDAPKAVWPLAQRSLLAHLIDLVEQHRARRDGDTFSA